MVELYYFYYRWVKCHIEYFMDLILFLHIIEIYFKDLFNFWYVYACYHNAEKFSPSSLMKEWMEILLIRRNYECFKLLARRLSEYKDLYLFTIFNKGNLRDFIVSDFDRYFWFSRYKFVFEHLSKYNGNKFIHSTALELIWTIIPSIILFLIAIPSFMYLYAVDTSMPYVYFYITVKVIGHQWYWSYTINNINWPKYYLPGKPWHHDYDCIDTYALTIFDSYMVLEDDLQEGELRLLEVDNALRLPLKRYIRLVVTSSDVLHSWTVPSLGVKVDAVPGRLNQVNFTLNREGIFYGQCSEICGINHAFMPIKLKSMSYFQFDSRWMDSFPFYIFFHRVPKQYR